jgi:hypothetical protein
LNASAWATIATARPVMSLSGRKPDIQNNGDAASSAVAQNEIPPTLNKGRGPLAALYVPIATKIAHAAIIATPPLIADQLASAIASRRTGIE